MQYVVQSHNLAMHYMCNPTILQCNICVMLQSGNALFWATICNRTQRNFITSSHHAFLISGCWPTITVGGASSWGWMHFFSYLWLTQLHRQTFLFISDQLQLLQAPKCLLSGIPMKLERYHFGIISLRCKESSFYRDLLRRCLSYPSYFINELNNKANSLLPSSDILSSSPSGNLLNLPPKQLFTVVLWRSYHCSTSVY